MKLKEHCQKLSAWVDFANRGVERSAALTTTADSAVAANTAPTIPVSQIFQDLKVRVVDLLQVISPFPYTYTYLDNNLNLVHFLFVL